MSVRGEAIGPAEVAGAWSLDPLIALPLAAIGIAGAVGLSRVGARTRRRRAVPFTAGLAALALAALSPLDALSEALFSAHMVQHLVLVLVAPPLLIAAGAEVLVLLALPRGARRGLARTWKRSRLGVLASPGAAFVLHLAAVWAWHAPALYEWALRDEVGHALEHGAFLGTALLFWRVVMRPGGLAAPLRILYLFGMALGTGVLGALIAFAPTSWYAGHARSTAAFGLSPLEDQQLAGAIMWVPGGFAYAVAALVLLARLLERPARHPSWEGT